MKFKKTLALLTGLAVLSPATAMAAPATGSELAKSEISITRSISIPKTDLDRANAELTKAEKKQAAAAADVAKKEGAYAEKQQALAKAEQAYATAEAVQLATEADLAEAEAIADSYDGKLAASKEAAKAEDAKVKDAKKVRANARSELVSAVYVSLKSLRPDTAKERLAQNKRVFNLLKNYISYSIADKKLEQARENKVGRYEAWKIRNEKLGKLIGSVLESLKSIRLDNPKDQWERTKRVAKIIKTYTAYSKADKAYVRAQDKQDDAHKKVSELKKDRTDANNAVFHLKAEVRSAKYEVFKADNALKSAERAANWAEAKLVKAQQVLADADAALAAAQAKVAELELVPAA